MSPPPLLAVPNVSEGRDQDAIAAIGRGFTGSGRLRLMDSHSDADHHRSVFTLAGPEGGLAEALLEGAALAIEQIDLRSERGRHPYVGALDVLPVVHLDVAQRGAACAEALVVAEEIGEKLDVPVFLYGSLAQGRTRAELRRGGLAGLSERMRSGESRPDFGPGQPHRTAGVTLMAAREPLVAFNLELAPPATVADARRIAALIREGGAEGLPGVRAIGLEIDPERTGAELAQLSLNIERPLEVPLAEVVRAARRHGELTRAELVGLAPQAALAGFPADLPMPGFDPAHQVIEKALGL